METWSDAQVSFWRSESGRTERKHNGEESDAIRNPSSSDSGFTVPAGGASEATGLRSWERGGWGWGGGGGCELAGGSAIISGCKVWDLRASKLIGWFEDGVS